MSDTRWKGAPAGMGYGYAFNDHLQAMTAAAKAKMGIKEPVPEAPGKAAASGVRPAANDARRPDKR